MNGQDLYYVIKFMLHRSNVMVSCLFQLTRSNAEWSGKFAGTYEEISFINRDLDFNCSVFSPKRFLD